MSKRTELELKEDALLRMANDWQNFRLTWGKPDAWPMSSDAWDRESADAGASCALSEVAGMGYNLLNADGTPCEKTHEAHHEWSSDGADAVPVVKLRPVRR